MSKKFGMLLKLLLALLSALLRVPELIPSLTNRFMKLQLRLHVSDRTVSYKFMSDQKEVGFLCYDLQSGIFTAQSFPGYFTTIMKVKTYLFILKDVSRVINRLKFYEKES